MVFAVSSKLAMQGLIRGNNALIEKSRFNHFKLQLVSLLTANQKLDVHSKAKPLAGAAEKSVGEWYTKKINEINDKISSAENRMTWLRENGPTWSDELFKQLSVMDSAVSKLGISQDSVRTESIESMLNLKRIFINRISSISDSNFNVKSIMDALEEASRECCDALSGFGTRAHEQILKEMETVEKWTICRSASAGLDSTDLENNLNE